MEHVLDHSSSHMDCRLSSERCTMQSTRLLNSPATHVLANINSTLPTLLPSGGLGQLLEYWVQFTIPSLFCGGGVKYLRL